MTGQDERLRLARRREAEAEAQARDVARALSLHSDPPTPPVLPVLAVALAEYDNRAVRQVLQAAWRAIPAPMRPGFHESCEPLEQQFHARSLAEERTLTPYQRRVRERLKDSRLLGLLASGYLPEIEDVLQEPLLSLYALIRPRKRSQFVRHLLACLNWYLWPQEGLPLLQQLELVIGPLLLFGALLALLIAALAGAGDAQSFALYAFPLLGLVFSAGFGIVYSGLQRRWIHARELYEYFWNCLSADAQRRAAEKAAEAERLRTAGIEIDSNPEATVRRMLPRDAQRMWEQPWWPGKM